MLDVCLLGTGGMMPLPNRWLTSLIVKLNGRNLLIDCGEGTQIAIKEAGWTFKQIDTICFTHFHADHISGLPGILLAMANAERTKPLTIIGPKGLGRVVGGLSVLTPELPFSVELSELSGAEAEYTIGDLKLTAFRVRHRVTCYGYRIDVPRGGKFDPIRAKELEIPLKYWSRLQKGERIEEDGRIFLPEQVLGERRKGISLTYVTDTRPTDAIKAFARDVDLFICEGMYGEAEKQPNANAHRHMMMQEAAQIGAEAKPERMWLTHYSPSMPKPEFYLEELRKIYARIDLGTDGRSETLMFQDE